MPCVLSLCKIRILVADSLRLVWIHPVSLRFTQIHVVSLGFAQSHSDPPSLTEIENALRSARFLSDSFRFMQPRTDLFRFTQFQPGFHSDSVRVTEPPSNSSRSAHSDSSRFTQIHPDSLRHAWTRLINPESKRETLKTKGKGRGGQAVILSLIRHE